MTLKPSNPLLILQTLDGFLHTQFQLIVYGRSALALGFADPSAAYCVTMDVDAIDAASAYIICLASGPA
jgi:hypothetical protein